MSTLEFYVINFMPYPFIPPGEDLESSWVVLSNQHYDPRIGHQLYRQYLDMSIAAERLGFDGVLTNEHHQTAYGLMPNPNLPAAWIAAHTERIRIGVMGNVLNTHLNPMRVAEDIAMLDVMSGGRMISGFVFGTGMEYHSYGINPATGRERFWEAHDLIMKSWTEPGPFAWEGRHFHLPYVNPWPRPLQQPHPPVWLPGVSSLETIEAAARNRYTFMQVFSPRSALARACRMYREAAEGFGYKAHPNQLAATAMIYVAETDEQARREAEPHIMWFVRNGLKTPTYHLLPPGYTSTRSLRSILTSAEEVIPSFRASDGKPVWAREERPAVHTLTEHAATVGKPKAAPLVRMDGVGLVDSATAHVPELRKAVRE